MTTITVTDTRQWLPETLESVLTANTTDLLTMPHITLKRCGITDIKQNTFSLYKNLEHLDLSENKIKSIEKDAFKNLSNLRFLSLENNILENNIDFEIPDSLEIINLSNNRLSNIKPFPCCNLVRIVLKGNTTLFSKKAVISPFTNLHKLEEIEFETCVFTNLTKGFFPQSLKVLHINHCVLKEIQPDFWESLPNIETVSLKNNDGLRSIGDLSSCTKLKYLDVSCNNLVSIKNKKLVLPSCIEILDLSECGINYIRPDFFRGLSSLKEVDLGTNRLEKLTVDLSDCVNLVTLNLSINFLSYINKNTFNFPVEKNSLEELFLNNNGLIFIGEGVFSNLKNLKTLDLSCNSFVKLRNENIFRGLSNLEKLDLSFNDLKIFSCGNFLVNLKELEINGNSIDDNEFLKFCRGDSCFLPVLEELDISNNKLTAIPIEIIIFTRLDNFAYEGNEYRGEHHPIVERFIERIEEQRYDEGDRGSVYKDSQNVHNNAIQKSVKNSIINLLKDDEIKKPSYDTLEKILKDKILTDLTKRLLKEYFQDNTQHSVLFVTFADVLKCVWKRIEKHSSASELKQILNQEMKDSENKCFTGRISRLVNVLSGGFYSDITVDLNKNLSTEIIGTVITNIQKKLEDEGKYTVEKHREAVASELTERGFEEETIKVWVGEIV